MWRPLDLTPVEITKTPKKLGCGIHPGCGDVKPFLLLQPIITLDCRRVAPRFRLSQSFTIAASARQAHCERPARRVRNAAARGYNQGRRGEFDPDFVPAAARAVFSPHLSSVQAHEWQNQIARYEDIRSTKLPIAKVTRRNKKGRAKPRNVGKPRPAPNRARKRAASRKIQSRFLRGAIATAFFIGPIAGDANS